MTQIPYRPTRRSVVAGAMALGLPNILGRAFAADMVDVAAAKREGKVALYTSAPLAAAQSIAAAFKEKYGITIELFRTGGVQVLRRFQMEQDSGHAGADMLATSDLSAAMDFKAKGLFVPFKPDGFEKIPEAFREPKGYYVPERVSIISIYGRTDIVPAAEMPKTWDDLLNPKWKGKLVMTNPNFSSLQVAVVAMLSRAKGWGFFEQLNKNDVMVVQGNEQVLNTLKTGERLIAAGADSQYATGARLAGYKVDNFFPTDGTFAAPALTSVVKNAKNPNAAKLLSEFTLSLEAQRLWPKSGVYAARNDVEPPEGSPPISSIKLLPTDYAHVQRSGASVKKRFSEIFSI